MIYVGRGTCANGAAAGHLIASSLLVLVRFSRQQEAAPARLVSLRRNEISRRDRNTHTLSRGNCSQIGAAFGAKLAHSPPTIMIYVGRGTCANGAAAGHLIASSLLVLVRFSRQQEAAPARLVSLRRNEISRRDQLNGAPLQMDSDFAAAAAAYLAASGASGRARVVLSRAPEAALVARAATAASFGSCRRRRRSLCAANLPPPPLVRPTKPWRLSRPNAAETSARTPAPGAARIAARLPYATRRRLSLSNSPNLICSLRLRPPAIVIVAFVCARRRADNKSAAAAAAQLMIDQPQTRRR